MKNLLREIIFHVVAKYLDTDTFQRIRNEMGERNYTDAKFIKLLEKYFDFSKLIKNPIDPEVVWIYNYLNYETRQKGKMILGRKTKEYFK